MLPTRPMRLPNRMSIVESDQALPLWTVQGKRILQPMRTFKRTLDPLYREPDGIGSLRVNNENLTIQVQERFDARVLPMETHQLQGYHLLITMSKHVGTAAVPPMPRRIPMCIGVGQSGRSHPPEPSDISPMNLSTDDSENVAQRVLSLLSTVLVLSPPIRLLFSIG